jgi:hypothetical protein
MSLIVNHRPRWSRLRLAFVASDFWFSEVIGGVAQFLVVVRRHSRL